MRAPSDNLNEPHNHSNNLIFINRSRSEIWKTNLIIYEFGLVWSETHFLKRHLNLEIRVQMRLDIDNKTPTYPI